MLSIYADAIRIATRTNGEIWEHEDRKTRKKTASRSQTPLLWRLVGW